MSTTIHVYIPEEPVEAMRPITLAFHWEGTPTFAYGLSIDDAHTLAQKLISAVAVTRNEATMPVCGEGPCRSVGTPLAIEVHDLPCD